MKPSPRAVALEYGERPTPVVTASAEGQLAQRMLEEARIHGVHIAHDPVLVEALSRLAVDQPIPEALYEAVAVLLSWVYWLNGMHPGDEKPPENRAPG